MTTPSTLEDLRAELAHRAASAPPADPVRAAVLTRTSPQRGATRPVLGLALVAAATAVVATVVVSGDLGGGGTPSTATATVLPAPADVAGVELVPAELAPLIAPLAPSYVPTGLSALAPRATGVERVLTWDDGTDGLGADGKPAVGTVLTVTTSPDALEEQFDGVEEEGVVADVLVDGRPSRLATGRAGEPEAWTALLTTAQDGTNVLVQAVGLDDSADLVRVAESLEASTTEVPLPFDVGVAPQGWEVVDVSDSDLRLAAPDTAPEGDAPTTGLYLTLGAAEFSGGPESHPETIAGRPGVSISGYGQVGLQVLLADGRTLQVSAAEASRLGESDLERVLASVTVLTASPGGVG